MNRHSWIVCECTQRWAAALRLLLDQETQRNRTQHRLIEVRHLEEASARLSEHPDSLVSIEVDRANFGDVIAWLTAASRRFGRARFVALADYALQPNPWESDGNGMKTWQDAAGALQEAGAAMVAATPRELETIVQFGRRHAAALSVPGFADNTEMPIRETVWATLPWQTGQW
jgi:hypothetical protein